jgi:hypothetical protein
MSVAEAKIQTVEDMHGLIWTVHLGNYMRERNARPS